MDNKGFRILSVDGGGYRGVFAANVLKKIEVLYENFDWRKEFNLMAGTSTGSIIVAALATGKKATEIATFYDGYGEKIFPKKNFWQRCFNPCGIRKKRYDSSILKGLLEKTFGNITLGQIDYPLFIPATNIETGNVFVMKTNYGKFDRDKDIRLVDAILASCAAPTYFKPHEMGDYFLADGGLWANNPALMAMIEAKFRLGQDINKVKVLSIGTGRRVKKYTRTDNPVDCRWGAVTWGIGMLELILNLQSVHTENMINLLFGDGRSSPNVLRIDFSNNSNIPLDQPKYQKELAGLASEAVTYASDSIHQFFEDHISPKPNQTIIKELEND